MKEGLTYLAAAIDAGLIEELIELDLFSVQHGKSNGFGPIVNIMLSSASGDEYAIPATIVFDKDIVGANDKARPATYIKVQWVLDSIGVRGEE